MDVSNATASSFFDLAGLDRLRARVADHSDKADLKEVARQFESIFVNMMLKEARRTVFDGGIFSNQQMQMYQGMFDQQISVEMTKTQGIGLAQMIVRQLQGSLNDSGSQ